MKIEHLIDIDRSFDEVDDNLVLKRTQEISPHLLDELAESRLRSKDRAGEYHHIATIPVIIVEKWLREGFDIYREDARTILAKLRHEDLGAFISTNKRI
jgi:hypothetical protein